MQLTTSVREPSRPASPRASSDVAVALNKRLFDEHRVEVPIIPFAGRLWARISAQVYNTLDDYRRLTGDRTANEIAWWLDDRSQVDGFIDRARALSPLTDTMEYRDTAQLKSLSLTLFDRSFAITYVLEAIAIAVALFGVACAVAGEALARQREFGMLRHLGLARGEVGRQFAAEAALGALIASVWGLVLGAGVAWVLVHRDRKSTRLNSSHVSESRMPSSA